MCTSIVYENAVHDFFLARTMDFSIPLEGQPIYIPSGYSFYKKEEGKGFESIYSFVGAGRLFQEYTFADGINEAGLGIASLYFADDAYYEENKAIEGLSLAPHDVVAFVLGTCQTVEDVKEKIQGINIVPEDHLVINGVLPLHWIVTDKSGSSIVIEPVKEGLKIYDNPVGVMANSPNFPWHLTNLNQYAHLSNTSKQTGVYQEFIAKGNGAGSGALGLPGDYTSISRFVHLAFMNQYTEKVQSTEASIQMISRMLSAVYIPKGVKIKANGAIDYTQFTSFMDLSGATYYINFYETNRFNQLSLKDLAKNKEPKIFDVNQSMVVTSLV